MAFVFFAQSMFGILIEIRILRGFRDRSLISTPSLTKIGTAFALLVCFSTRLEPRLSFFAVVCTLLTLKFFLKSLESRRIETMLAHFPRFLDHWILNLRVGLAPKLACESALNASEGAFQALVRPVLLTQSPNSSARPHLFLRDRLVQELQQAQNQSHSTIVRLEALRDFVRRESDFRRKSGQALRQASIQSVVMLVLHFALCCFVILRSGWSAAMDLIILSSALTMTGALVLRLLARRIKWTI